MTAFTYKCGACGKSSRLDIAQMNRPNCPKCGSTEKATIEGDNFNDSFLIEETAVKGVAKDPTLTGKKKRLVEFKSERSLTRDTGRMSKRQVLVDRVNDNYEEHVVDAETGELVYKCKEPLSKHRGHGDAKKRT